MGKKNRPSPIRRANVSAHTYDPDTRELTVTFHSGARYRYSDVDGELAGGLQDCPSMGSYLHKHIIGRHSTTKLDD